MDRSDRRKALAGLAWTVTQQRAAGSLPARPHIKRPAMRTSRPPVVLGARLY